MRLPDIEIKYNNGDGTDIWVSDSHEIQIPMKKTGNKRIDRLVQKAEADQIRAKIGRWK